MRDAVFLLFFLTLNESAAIFKINLARILEGPAKIRDVTASGMIEGWSVIPVCTRERSPYVRAWIIQGLNRMNRRRSL